MRVDTGFVVDFVRRLLGYPHVKLEISYNDIEQNLAAALLFISPYSSSTSFIDRTVTNPINLSEDGVTEVVRIYESIPVLGSVGDAGLDPFLYNSVSISNVFSGGSSFSTVDRALSMFRSSERSSMRSQNFRFIEGKLYISGYQGSSVTIECLKDIQNVSELNDNFLVSWVLKYTLALSQVTVGYIRRKYTVSSSPITNDGESMVQEGTSAIQELEQQIRDGSTGFFYVEHS